MTIKAQKNQEPGSIEQLKTQPQEHLNYLDGLRALTALYVVLYHAVTWQVILPTQFALKLTSWLLYGHFAVDVFIVVSGFSLMLSIVRGDSRLRGGYWNFMKRRARRTLLPYYCALLFSLALALTTISSSTRTSWDICLPVTLPAVMTHLFLVQDVFSTYFYSISSPLWSIAVEWHLYFLFPLLIFGWSRFGAAKTIITAIILSCSMLFAVRHTQIQGITPQYLALFSFGMLGATISFSKEAIWSGIRRLYVWLPILIIMSSIVAIFCHRYDDYLVVRTHAGQADFLVGITTMCFLVIASLPGRNLVKEVLSWHPLVFIGTFTYSLYLIHYPLMQIVWQYFLHPYHLNFVETLLGMIFIACPTSLIFAFLFFLVCEKPFLNSLNKASFHKKPQAIDPPVVVA